MTRLLISNQLGALSRKQLKNIPTTICESNTVSEKEIRSR